MRGAVSGLPEVARALSEALDRVPTDAPRFVPLAPARPPPGVAAVDGSSVVLAESGAHALVAYRAACVRWGPEGTRVEASPTHVALLHGREASAELDARRSAVEAGLARASLAGLGRGDALLVDGALASRPPAGLLDAVVREAGARGVDAVGVCKSTSLTLGAAPALAGAQLAARAAGLGTWATELAPPPHVLGRVFVARLSRAEERAFRFDVAAAEGDPVGVLGRLAGLAGHPGYPGYPSPLAMAHHAAVIGEDERRRLLASVADEAERAGVRGEAWRALFFDYHDVLDLGV